MNITKETIERLAHLSRLPVTADDGMTEELSRIIGYMSAVRDSHLSDQTVTLHDVFREDEVSGAECPTDPVAFTVPKAVK